MTIAYYVSIFFSFIVNDLRMTLLNSVIKSDWASYKNKNTSEILNALFLESNKVGGLFQTISKLVSGCFQLLFAIILAVIISVEFVILATFLGGVIWVFLFKFIKISTFLGKESKDVTKKSHQNVNELINNIKPLKSMNAENVLFKQVGFDMKSLFKISYLTSLSKHGLSISREFLMIIIFLITVYVISEIFQFKSSEFVVMAAVIYKIINYIGFIQQTFQTHRQQISFFFSFRNLCKYFEDNVETISGDKKIIFRESITFNNLSFSYKKRELFKNLNLKIPFNQITAITGKSGIGKSTIVDLIIGLYKPTRGEIRVDKTSLSDVNIYEWRKKIGFVPQEFSIFNDTIKNNINLHQRKYSDSRVMKSLKMSGSIDFVNLLPEKLQTLLGEKGNKISGGQRQRISLARAVIKKPKLLILDEATSSLDLETEEKILKSLKILKKEMCIIVITHKLSSLKYFDNHIDLDKLIKK
tara:strand:+ start:164 stop:1576 length:1413 start_codon:yes stop_codon:yes gene_type:complete